MYVTLDIGGTNIRIGFFDSLIRPKLLKKIVMPTVNNYRRDLDKISQSVSKHYSGKIKKIGVSVAGRLRADKTGLVSSRNLTSWEGKRLVQDLKSRFNCPVVMENDAVAAALGQAVYGQKKKEDFLLLIWGSGIGGAEVKYLGQRINAFGFEPGRQIISVNGRANDWESFCSGMGIKASYKKEAKKLSAGQWNEVCRCFAFGLANVLNIRPANAVILGGGIALGQFKRINSVNKMLKRRFQKEAPQKIRLPAFKDNAGLYGALGLIKNHG
ncbi:MAG: ROK family protein [Candidatus Komeilibacteria bacterium]|nr:ROK family protein [Candidatus Komeilibacteria bacterium]